MPPLKYDLEKEFFVKAPNIVKLTSIIKFDTMITFLLLKFCFIQTGIRLASSTTFYPFQPNIYIDKSISPSFYATVIRDLAILKTTFTGNRLLYKVAQGLHAIYITYGPDNLAIPHSASFSLPHQGCGTTIHFSAEPFIFGREGLSLEVAPSYLILAHELIHAYHIQRGKSPYSCYYVDPSLWKTDEEYRTIIGFPTKKKERENPKITENTLRKELGFPPRMDYYDWFYGLGVTSQLILLEFHFNCLLEKGLEPLLS